VLARFLLRTAHALAATDNVDAARPGLELTPVGAEQVANADGRIPPRPMAPWERLQAGR